MGWVSLENYAKAGVCTKCLGQGWEPSFSYEEDGTTYSCSACGGAGKIEPVFPPKGTWECSRCGVQRAPHCQRDCPRCDSTGTAVEVQ